MQERCDVLMIGSGPVGITAARRPVEHGLQVTVVEAGSPISKPPGSHFRNQTRFRHDPDSYFAAIERYFLPVAGDLPSAADSLLVGGQACSGPTIARGRPSSSAGTRWRRTSGRNRTRRPKMRCRSHPIRPPRPGPGAQYRIAWKTCWPSKGAPSGICRSVGGCCRTARSISSGRGTCSKRRRRRGMASSSGRARV